MNHTRCAVLTAMSWRWPHCANAGAGVHSASRHRIGRSRHGAGAKDSLPRIKARGFGLYGAFAGFSVRATGTAAKLANFQCPPWRTMVVRKRP
jgi:hypothetical protein